MLVLVRHGETAANRAGLLVGRTDPPLDDTGRAQALALARVLAAEPPIAVVSSPLSRARETAAAIARAAGLDVEVDDRLIELDYGEWDGLAFAELPADAAARWRADPSMATPGGESLADVRARVVPAGEELLTRARDGVVVVVSHVSPIKAFVTWALGVGDEAAWRMHLRVASISRVDGRGGRPVLLSFDETVPV